MKLPGRIPVLCGLVILATSMVQAQAGPYTDQPTLLDKSTAIPDIADFMQIGRANPLGTSWDGSDVFFQSTQSGIMQAYRLTGDGWPYQLTTFESGIDFFALSWGGELAIVGASVGGSEQSALFLLDTRTGQSEQLTHQPDIRNTGVVWDLDDRSIYYSSNMENGADLNIYKMDITSGETVKIFGDSVNYSGAKYVNDLSQDGRRMIIRRWNSNVDHDLWLLNLIDGEITALTSDTTSVRYDNPTLMPDNQTIWLICNDNPEGINRLAKMKVGSPEIKFTADGWIDPRWESTDLTFSRDFKYMSLLVNENGYIRLKIREVESKQELPSPEANGIFDDLFIDSSGSCLASFASATQAPDVWRWSPHEETFTQLTFSTYAGIDRSLFSEPALVSYPSFDGLEIPAFLYLPPDYEEGQPIPIAVYAHGGPSSQFKPTFIRNFQYLMLNGIGILAPNVRGSRGYGRDYLALDDYKNRKHSLGDYKAATDWLFANNYTAPGMVGIWGGSYGGYVVLGMITEYPDLFAAAVERVGIVNFETFLQNTKAYRRKNREAEYGPLSDPEFLREISPIHLAHKITTPLLVIHGANDSRVPVSEARQLLKATAQNGGVVDSLIFADEGHSVRKRANVIASYRKQVEFLTKYLTAPPVDSATVEP